MPLESNTPKGLFWESVSLPVITGLAAGSYTNPTLTVDEYGRITAAASNPPTASIQTLDEGVVVTNSPFGIMNFTGAGVSATDAGGGVLEINIPGGGTGLVIQDESVIVVGGPHTTLNFIGASVSATNGGGGTADITITTQPYPKSMMFRQAAITTGASQNISTPVNAGSFVSRVIVTVTTPYSGGTTLSIQDAAANILMPTTDIDPTTAGTYVTEVAATTTSVGVGNEQLKAIITGAPGAGAAVVRVETMLP